MNQRWDGHNTALLERAAQRAQKWQEDGQQAALHGNHVWAEICFAKQRIWELKIEEHSSLLK